MGLKFSADTIGGWQNHFDRMGRWQSRALTAANNPADYDFADATDFVLAYFLWCHSLRDWLLKSGVPQADLDRELSQYPIWKICRDVANRTRHLKLTMNPNDKDWSIGREYDTWAKHEDRSEKHVLFLVANDRKYRVNDLVHQSYEMWKNILNSLAKFTN